MFSFLFLLWGYLGCFSSICSYCLDRSLILRMQYLHLHFIVIDTLFWIAQYIVVNTYKTNGPIAYHSHFRDRYSPSVLSRLFPFFPHDQTILWAFTCVLTVGFVSENLTCHTSYTFRFIRCYSPRSLLQAITNRLHRESSLVDIILIVECFFHRMYRIIVDRVQIFWTIMVSPIDGTSMVIMVSSSHLPSSVLISRVWTG